MPIKTVNAECCECGKEGIGFVRAREPYRKAEVRRILGEAFVKDGNVYYCQDCWAKRINNPRPDIWVAEQRPGPYILALTAFGLEVEPDGTE